MGSVRFLVTIIFARDDNLKGRICFELCDVCLEVSLPGPASF